MEQHVAVRNVTIKSYLCKVLNVAETVVDVFYRYGCAYCCM